MQEITLEKIKKTKEIFWDFIETTPLQYSERLSKKYKANIFLKREDLTKVRSYKIRWAFNLINSLNEIERKAWVVCASAGNHAQGFAISCNKLQIKWTVFMPVTTPEQKIYKTKQFWWDFIEVVLFWDNFDEALKKAKEFEEQNKAVFVHPFDDERTILWQSTIWLEIFEEMWDKEVDYIICPIWWGWVISWLISSVYATNNKTKVIWVESKWANWMQKSLELWQNTTLDEIDVFADWVAVKREWELTFQICKDYNLEVTTCPENRICSTILEYLKEDWIVVEPAWALSTDSLKDLKDKIIWKTVILIISWSNFDFERLAEVKERSLKFEWLKKYFLINFPQRPWALKQFLWCLWTEDNIERFEYLNKTTNNTAPVFIWLKTNNPWNWDKIYQNMKEIWFKYTDITDNELYFNLFI